LRYWEEARVRFGLHIGVAGGIAKSFQTARDCGCECVQLFSGNPTAWRDTPLSDKAIAETLAATAATGLTPLIYHTPYLINLATPRVEFREQSIALLLAALRKAGQIGVSLVNTHVGNHMGDGVAAGIDRIVSALLTVAPAIPDGCTLVLENGPGKGTEIGARLPELMEVVRRADLGDRLGLCLDTAHLWAAGYDLREPDVIDELLAELDAGVGLGTLRLLHGNDNGRRLGGLTDVHRHPGEGEIGLAPFADLYRRPEVVDLPVIMEMPGDTIPEQARSLALMQELAAGSQAALTSAVVIAAGVALAGT
jgi:deoxyribonuclease-4